jgi:hypothetical protein
VQPEPETHVPVRSADGEEAAGSQTDEPTTAPAAVTTVPQDISQQVPALEVGGGGGPLPPVESKEKGEAPSVEAVPSPVQAPAVAVTSDDVWLVDEPIRPLVPESPPPGTPTQQAAEPVKAASPSTGPLPAALVALLEEAELYLLPQWADYAEVARLLDRVEQEAPNHVRILELRERLRDAQQGGGAQDVTPLLREAEECLARHDFWEAVDLYEQALAKQPENADARSGVERARMLARWSAQWTGATGDAARLQTLGDEYAALAPDLAHQAYTAAFAATPTVEALHGLLVSLVRGNRGAAVVATARDGVVALRIAGRLAADGEQDSALETLARCGEPGLPEAEAERMIAAFSRLLAGEIE